MNLAYAASMRSEDYFGKQVGAAILDENGMVLGVGYNGTVPGVSIDWNDREKRRPYVIHAEMNAMRLITPLQRPRIMAVTYYPCGNCILMARAYGVEEVVWHVQPHKDYAERESEVGKIALKIGLHIRRILDYEMA